MSGRLLALAATLTSLAILPTRASAAKPATIPFHFVNNHIYVDVMLLGGGPYHFVFDSGSPFNLIDTNVARNLGLIVRSRGSVGGVGNGEERAGSTTVGTVGLGDVVLEKESFVVTRLQATIGAAEGRPVDGVIGRDVLARYVTTFDYERGTVTLGADFGDVIRGGAAILPMTVHGGIPQVACRISGVAGRCNVDTGSRLPVTVLAPFAAAHPSVVPPDLTALGIDGFGLGGAAYGRLGKLRALEIGEFAVRDAICDFSAQTRGAFADAQTAANVGSGVWRRFMLTFDYAHDRIALQANADFTGPEDFDHSGLFLTGRDGAVRVLDVRPETPAAAAAISKDDRVVALDGRTLGTDALPQIRADLSAAPGTVVTLRLERNGTQHDVALMLRDYVGSQPLETSERVAKRDDFVPPRYGFGG